MLSVLIVCVNVLHTSAKNTHPVYSDFAPADTIKKDAKAIVTDYINAIGGMDAVTKLNSINATGNLSVQGMLLDVTQKQMAPNKTLQVVTMNGTTAGKTVFDGTKGYAEQMGNKVDMNDEEMSDLKANTLLVEQANYLTGSVFKLSVLGIDTVNGSNAYKVAITTPSGKTNTEYYDVASKLLVKKSAERTVNGQTVSTTYQYSDYKKAGDVTMPYTLGVSVAAGAMNQAFTIVLTDIKVNEGVTDADFQ